MTEKKLDTLDVVDYIHHRQDELKAELLTIQNTIKNPRRLHPAHKQIMGRLKELTVMKRYLLKYYNPLRN